MLVCSQVSIPCKVAYWTAGRSPGQGVNGPNRIKHHARWLRHRLLGGPLNPPPHFFLEASPVAAMTMSASGPSGYWSLYASCILPPRRLPRPLHSWQVLPSKGSRCSVSSCISRLCAGVVELICLMLDPDRGQGQHTQQGADPEILRYRTSYISLAQGVPCSQNVSTLLPYITVLAPQAGSYAPPKPLTHPVGAPSRRY